mgnify:FL=1
MGKCDRTNVEDSNSPPKLADAIFSGGLGYGKVCVPTSLTDFLLIIIDPPGYVLLLQKRNGFNNIRQIFVSFILTSLFYFPGLIHALYLKQNREICGGLFGQGDI